MSAVLPLPAWPETDQTMWRALLQPGGPLDERGPMAHWRETSLRMRQGQYGRWLGWLAVAEPAALEEPPAARATLPRLASWLEALAYVEPMSRHMFMHGMLSVLRMAAPDADWSAHLRVVAHLNTIAGRGSRARKEGRILSSGTLLEAGLRLAGPTADAAGSPLVAATCRRDGLMVAMLALLPMRRRAFAGLELGSSLLLLPNEIVVALPAELTKTGVPWETAVPAPVLPALRSYLDEVRPWLMARSGARHDALWVDNRGRPYALSTVGTRIGDITLRLLGVRVPAHFFRDAAATTLARISPEGARLSRPVLAHSNPRTAERHYNQARGLEAGRDYAALIRRMKKGER